MHMKRYSMPSFWPLARKANKFVVTPSPGGHPKRSSIALRVVLRDVLGYADNAGEAGSIIKKGDVLVDRKPVKDDRYPVGLMDVIEFPSSKKQFRVIAGRKGLELEEISTKEADKKLCAIRGKKPVKGGKLQVALHDGRTLIVPNGSKYKPGDSLLLELPSQKILSHFQLKEGVSAMVVAGKNMGTSGKIKSIFQRKSMMERTRVMLDTKEGDIETLSDYVLVGDMK